MPTVLRKGGYRFHFYSGEGNEPSHIHVAKGDSEAKFWLEPVCLATNDGMAAHELQKILKIVKQYQKYLIEKYGEYHGI